MSLSIYKYNIYSQNGEDGIIAEIFKRLEITGGWVCEIGAADGIWLSNTANLWKTGNFKAVLIECDKSRKKDLNKNTEGYQTYNIIGCANQKNPLQDILKQTKIPKNFELLSIDTDSFDYELWEELTEYKPKVVIIEVDSERYRSDKGAYYISTERDRGSSPAAMIDLAQSKGYELAAHTGNCIFVKKSLFRKLNIPDNSLEELWSY